MQLVHHLKLSILAFSIIALSACGGGGSGKKSAGPELPPASSSSKSSSSSTVSISSSSATSLSSSVSSQLSVISSSVLASSSSAISSSAVVSSSAIVSSSALAPSSAVASSSSSSVQLIAQSIRFTLSDTIDAQVGDSFSNVPSLLVEGAGARSYESSDTSVATVNNQGLVNVVGAGIATVTFKKAADERYAAVSASYKINAGVAISAWIGRNDTQVTLPAVANLSFISSSSPSCDFANILSCSRDLIANLTGSTILDPAVTLNRSAVYSLVRGTEASGLPVNQERFSQRFGHQVATFNHQLWLIGGASTDHKTHKEYSHNDIWTSTDGTHWQLKVEHAQFSARNNHALINFNNKLWLIGGTDGSKSKNDIWSSADGITWVLEQENAEVSARSLHHIVNLNNTLWLFGGRSIDQGVSYTDIWFSQDGTHWVQQAAKTAFAKSTSEFIAYNNKLWLIDAEKNTIHSSSDGISWAEHLIPAAQPLGAFTYSAIVDNTLWLLNNRDAWSTVDGTTWIHSNTPLPIATRDAGQVVAFNQNIFLIGGDNGNHTYQNDVWSSADGNHWQQQTTSAAFPGSASKQVVTFKDKLWLMAGNESAHDIWSSSDGIRWSRVNIKAAFSPRILYNLVAYNNKLWIFGGFEKDYTRVDDIWSSSDGVNWTLEKAHTDFPHESMELHFFEANNRLYTFGSSDDKQTAWSSTDAINWEQNSLDTAFTGSLNRSTLASFNNKLWSLDAKGIWSSSDGIHWTKAADSAPFPADTHFYTVTVANKLWLINGLYRPYSESDIWSSSDAIHWTRETADTGIPTSDTLVGYNSQLWLFNGNEVWKSSNGIDWRKGLQDIFPAPQ